MSTFHHLCPVTDLPEGTARAFSIGDQRVGVFNIGGRFYAVDDSCPHAGASLARGEVAGEVVRCRIHQWGFCLRDGTYLDEDKPQFNLRRYRIRVAGNALEIEL